MEDTGSGRAVEDFAPMLVGEDRARSSSLIVDIMVDFHGRHFPANVLEFCRVLAPYGRSSLNSRCLRRMSTPWPKFAAPIWLPTDAPGLDISVNEEARENIPFRQEIMASSTVRAANGGILDW